MITNAKVFVPDKCYKINSSPVTWNTPCNLSFGRLRQVTDKCYKINNSRVKYKLHTTNHLLMKTLQRNRDWGKLSRFIFKIPKIPVNSVVRLCGALTHLRHQTTVNVKRKVYKLSVMTIFKLSVMTIFI